MNHITSIDDVIKFMFQEHEENKLIKKKKKKQALFCIVIGIRYIKFHLNRTPEQTYINCKLN